MSEWKQPEWTQVSSLMARNGRRAVHWFVRPLQFVTAREVQRARIVTTAAAARALLDQMETAGVLASIVFTPACGGRPVWVYLLPSEADQVIADTSKT